jgi:hypothetical protein
MITASGGTAPHAFSITSGTLPVGLTLNATTGEIAGTPTASNGAGANITVTAVDANGCSGLRAYSLKVCPAIALAPATLANGTVGTAYSQTVSASNGATPYVYSISVGSLPSGLALNTTSGVISGIPTAFTAANFTVSVTDANGCQATRSYTVTPVCPNISLNPISIAAATVGSAYGQTFVASAGSAPFTYTVTSGTLPAGLALDSSTGVLSGTPSSTVAATFTLRVADQYGCSGSRTYTLTPVCPAISVTPGALPLAKVGTSYTQALAAGGGTAPYSWALTAGTLPAGLSFNVGTAAITGTPTTANGAGVSLTFTVTDGYGCQGTLTTTIIVCLY